MDLAALGAAELKLVWLDVGARSLGGHQRHLFHNGGQLKWVNAGNAILRLLGSPVIAKLADLLSKTGRGWTQGNNGADIQKLDRGHMGGLETTPVVRNDRSARGPRFF
jgi:hypothetical protein